MKIPRSTVDDALFATVDDIEFTQAGVTKTWEYSSKHWQDWSNTSNQPAFYLRKPHENSTSQLRGLNKYVLKYELWVYFQVDKNPDVDIYDQYVNPILDALDAAINPDPTIDQDFNNLENPSIANCRWNGDADIADGALDGQGVIVIPVEVSVSG